MDTIISVDDRLLSDIWDCPSCGEYLDLWWMIERDLCWVSNLDDAIDLFEDQMTEVMVPDLDPDTIYNDMDIYCLCCDKPYHECNNFQFDKSAGTSARPITNQKVINEDNPDEYIRNKGIRWDDIYEEDLPSGCHTCKYYRDTACIPLRNVIRYHHETKRLPYFNLSYCKFHDEDPDAAASLDEMISTSRASKDGNALTFWEDID